MRRRLAAALALGVLGALAPAPPAPALVARSREACFRQTSSETALVRRINSARSSRSLRRLSLDKQLSRVARRHSWEMDRKDRLYRTPRKTLGWRVTRWEVLRENVGVGRSAEAVRKAFMHAPSFRANVRNAAFRHVGVGIRHDGGRVWVTALFEARKDPGTRLTLCPKKHASDPAPAPAPSESPSPAPSPDPTASPEVTAPPAPSGDLSISSPTPSSATLSWTPPGNATAVEVSRDGRVVDRVSAASTFTYTDRLLWPSTSYVYRVRAVDRSGGTVETATTTVETGPRSGSFERLFSAESPWNQPIPNGAAVDPNSAAMIQTSILPYKSTTNFANTNAWGIPAAYASAESKLYSVICLKWGCSTAVSARIPTSAQPTTGSDHHLAVLDPSSGKELDMWEAVRDASADTWTAGSRYLMDLDGRGSCGAEGTKCGSSVAAGFALMAGVVRPEEIAQGHIDHALVFTTPKNRINFIACPATWTDGRSDDPNALPEGARIQLDPAFDVDAQPWPRWKKVIARALQTYGAINVDNGGTISIRGEAPINRGYDAWGKAGTPSGPSLSDLPWDRMRVLKVVKCGSTA